ncbi:MAG: C-terminal helicase domain-containing protein, partial [Bacteroidota bacterium]
AASAIHGNKSQPQRIKALADFKAGEITALVATDIASRGIDIAGIEHIINFDIPQTVEEYIRSNSHQDSDILP